MTVKEAARRLQREPQSVYAYVKKGWLGADRKGRRIDISEQSLSDFQRGFKRVSFLYKGE